MVARVSKNLAADLQTCRYWIFLYEWFGATQRGLDSKLHWPLYARTIYEEQFGWWQHVDCAAFVRLLVRCNWPRLLYLHDDISPWIEASFSFASMSPTSLLLGK